MVVLRLFGLSISSNIDVVFTNWKRAPTEDSLSTINSSLVGWKHVVWLALKTRIADPDVVVLVANDLARIHRKTWHMGRAMEELDHHGVCLIFAAPGREVDIVYDTDRAVFSLDLLRRVW